MNICRNEYILDMQFLIKENLLIDLIDLNLRKLGSLLSLLDV